TVADRAEEWRVRVFPDGRPLDARHIVADSAPGASPPADSVRRLARAALAAAGLDTTRFAESDLQTEARPHRQDATVTYTDTSVHLPAGAAARAWVSFAGVEPLVVRRGVELPEAFRRAQRERQTRAFAMAGLWFMLVFAALVTGVVYVARRRPAVLDDRVFDRRTSFVLIGIVAAGLVAGVLNNWRSVLFGYDTATPWGNHLATAAISVVVAPIGALVLAGAWQVMEMLRRRAGIVAWPGASRDVVRDAAMAGLGLGGVFSLADAVPELVRESSFGAVPATALNHLVPALDRVLALPFGTGANVAFLAIPVLLLVAAAPTARLRWLIVGLVVAVTAGILGPVASNLQPEPVNVPRALLSLGVLVALVAALVHWGRRGAFTWLVGALLASAFAGAAGLAHARTAADAAGGTLTIAAAAAALLWLWRTAHRSGPS
ncbi:MAG TPA: hypothetical protein VG916_07885, partial [Gemmatimonadaceae bacterium]|nr:hypothetical protein [Gemmatimonadaceae bacterium]